MDDAEHSAFAIHHHKGGYLLLFHNTERGGCECLRWDGEGICCDAITGGEVHHVFSFFLQQPSQIAVADDTEQAVTFDHGGYAELLARHFVDHDVHFGLCVDSRSS